MNYFKSLTGGVLERERERERERESKRLRRFVKFLFSFVFVLTLFFTAHSSVYAATYPKLEHYNGIPPNLTSSDGSQWLYGFGGATLFRTTEGVATTTTMNTVTNIDPTYSIINVFATTTPNLIFVLVRNSSLNNYLYRSADGGTTLTKVFTFGAGNGPAGADTTRVYILKDLLEIKYNYPGTSSGVGDLYIGEYNINSSRTPGGTNDRVRILKSTDHGLTWNAVMTWNTSGHQVDHIHNIQQDPYTGYVYILTGDADVDSNIIRWDGVSGWTDNSLGSSIANWSGFKVLTGLARYRTTDLIFDANNIYSFTDSTIGEGTSSELGIWKGSKDLSSFVRVNSDILSYDNYHVGWYGENLNGTLIFTTSPEYVSPGHTWTKSVGQIYTSSDGDNWKATAGFGFLNDSTASQRISSMFQFNGKLYIYGNGAGFVGTDILYVNGNFTDTEPVIIHPVYYVGTWNIAGNDTFASYGTSKDYPKATLGNLLTSSIMTYGGRVRVASGTYNENSIIPNWSAASSPGSPLISVVIEGQSLTNTIVNKSIGIDYLFSIDTSKTGSTSTLPLIFKNITLVNTAAGNANVLQLLTGSGVEIRNSQIGDIYGTDYDLVQIATNASFTSKDSYLVQRSGATTGNCIGFTGTGNSSATLQYSILRNCVIGIKQKYAGTALSVLNSVFKDYSNRGILVDTDVTSPPTIKNTVFSGNTSTNPIEDTAGLTETTVDYNSYSHTNLNVTDGGHNLSIGTDPKFTGGAGHDISGSVTRANLKASFANGYAFVDFSSTGTLTSYVGDKLYLIDSTGKRYTGYIKAAGTTESYSDDLITNSADRDFSSDTGWWTKSGWTISGGVATHTSASYSNLSRASLLTLNSLYKAVTTTSNTVNLGFGSYLKGVSGTNITSYGVAAGNTNLTYGTTSSGITLDDVSLKQVIVPGATGVTITSTNGGSTYNWESIDAGFNYNDANYTYRIVSPYDFTPLSSSPLIDTGTNVGLVSDFIGTTVPQGCFTDIGAYEFQTSSSCSTSTSLSTNTSSGPQYLGTAPLPVTIIANNDIISLVNAGVFKYDAYLSVNELPKTGTFRLPNSNYWQAGSIYQVWWKSWFNNAEILPSEVVKPFTLIFKYSESEMEKTLPEANLKLAYSADEKSWSVLPNALINLNKNEVALVTKQGGYYMLVSGYPLSTVTLGAETQNLASPTPEPSFAPAIQQETPVPSPKPKSCFWFICW